MNDKPDRLLERLLDTKTRVGPALAVTIFS